MLTPKQSLFVKEYLVDLNATQAAIRAGHKFKNVPPSGYYVYLLANPDTGKIFYVGKGTKKRMSKHVSDAEKGIIDNVGKFSAIREILKIGKKPSEFVFGVSENEKKMFSLENKLIRSFRSFGLENIAAGFKDNQRIEIEKCKIILKSIRKFDDWKKIVPTENIDWIIKNHKSLENFYANFRNNVINNIIHLERNANT